MLHLSKVKFKSGATSIYVVVIATLLFSVITVSFIRIIVNEANRTTSDELAQSAYDSALAGVEDAKVALKKYYDCSSAGDTDEECKAIRTYFEDSVKASHGEGDHADDPCQVDAVPKILGRYDSAGVGSAGEVLIQEFDSNTNEDVVQAYTCILLNNILPDYRSELSSNVTTRVIPLRTDDVTKITGIQIAWYDEKDGDSGNSYNFSNAKGNFNSLSSSIPTPPTISAQIIQTAGTYTLADLDTSVDGKTDRGTVFLVPEKATTLPSYKDTHVSSDTLVKSNDHVTRNDPIGIPCTHSGVIEGLSDEFACVASISLPAPVGASLDGSNHPSERNDKTFFLVLSLPYGTPNTRFSVKLCTDTEGYCTETADFKDAQISIDSTGRANDMYSRVEARVEFNDIYFPFPEFAIQATGTGDAAVNKSFYVTKDCWWTSGTDGSITDCNDSASI